MSTSATVPMLSPDGQMGDIPHDQVPKAVAAGFKIGADLTAPNGTQGVVPLERVHEAINSGFMLKGVPIGKIPQPDMQTSFLGTLEGGPTDVNPSGSKVPRSIQNAPDSLGDAIAGVTGAGVAALGAAPVLGAVASKYPWVWKAAKTLAASEAIGQARKIPYAGKLIPPGSEILPFLGLGGKAAAAEPTAAEAATAAEMPAGSAALGEVPTPATQPAAQTGEALGTIPTAPWRMKPQAAALGDTPAPATARQFTNKVGPMIDEGLGNPPTAKPAVNPGQPIYRRTAASAAPVPAEGSVPTGNIPEGHTPVEDSTAVRSFKYDADAQELHIAPTKGYTYVYGDVSPDQATQFQNADSKGTAWGSIRNSNPLVAKIHENGTRTAMKPSAAGDDLTGVLQQSVDAAQKAKWKMKTAQ